MSDTDEFEEDGGIFSDSEKVSNGLERGVKRKADSVLKAEYVNEGKSCVGKKKLRKESNVKKLHKPPTVEELNRLRETESLFHSNLFRRQIEEILQELEITDKYKVRVNTWFEKFSDWLAKMEDSDDKNDLSNLSWLKNLRIPVSFDKAVKGWYQFKKPLKSKMIGSYVTRTLLGPGNIDILVEMPASFFQKEDYLNNRYHLKRAIYLSEVGRHFQLMGDLVEDIRYVCEEGNNRSPLIEIVPSGKLRKNTVFTIHPVPERGSFKLTRFTPSKNNVRLKWFYGNTEYGNDNEFLPTPMYNSSILRDLRMADNEEYVMEEMAASIQLRDAIVLLKVWLKQRELNIGHGGFTGFLVTLLIAYLLHIRKLNLTMSSYQIVRCVWIFLSSSDWSSNGLTLAESGDSKPSLSEFHDHFPVVFLDPSGFLNVCAGMTRSIFQRFKDESECALRCLNSNDLNSFHILFMRPVPFFMLCDHTIVVHQWKKFDKLVNDHSPSNKKLDYCGSLYPQIRDIVSALVQKGVDQRIRRLIHKQPSRKQWAIGKKPPRGFSLTLGLILDPNTCFSLVDKGPAADAPNAQDFRDFWQGRSELRRFKDGSITEAVVWQAQTWEEKRLICRQVVNFIFKSKLDLEEGDFRYSADEVQSVLPKDIDAKTALVMAQYDELTKFLKDLPNVPLDIISVEGMSPVFRHSDLCPPSLPYCTKKYLKNKKLKLIEKKIVQYCEMIDSESIKLPGWCPPAEVVIQLGSSNKWPHDLEAVRRMKAALSIKIAQSLHSRHSLVSQPYQNYTDVLMKNCVFRLRIVQPGEIVFMKKSHTSDGVVKYADTVDSLKLERTLVHLPKITSALRGLHSQHSSLGPACCLAKRWVRAHLLDESYISDEAIDLLMASVYLNPEPYDPPHQPQLAFLRFLYLVAQTNWNLDYVLLNFNDELTNEEINGVRSFFDSNRSILPPVFIATPYDRERSMWTKEGPIPVVLLRLINLCKLTHSLLIAHFQSNDSWQMETIFKPSMTVYDVLITLNDFHIPKRHKLAISDGAVEENLSHLPVVEFDPVTLYLEELRESYGEWALFFNDSYGGAIIGVLWKPSIKDVKDVKVSHLYGRYLDKNTNKLCVDVDAVLEGFMTLGARLVKKIEVKDGDKFMQI